MSSTETLAAAQPPPTVPHALGTALGPAFFGNGELGVQLCSIDWSQTALGDTRRWPQSLRTAASICLGSPAPMLLAWGEQLAVLYNEGFRPVVGPRRHPRALGRTLADALPDAAPHFREVLSSGRPLPSCALGGDRSAFSCTLSPILEESGRVGGVLALPADGRESFAMADALGHDLRNPLAAILSAGQLLERRGENDPRIAEPARRIAVSTERLARMLDQLADLARLHAPGGLHLLRTKVDLAELTKNELERLQLRSSEWRVSFETAGDTCVEVDAPRFAQVVAALLGNACQHAGEAECRVRADGTAPMGVVLSFENDGAIPDEQLRVLFEPFHAAQVQGRARGLGLGLHLARAVVEGHGGQLQASCAGAVTRLTVVLPRAAVSPGLTAGAST